VVIALDYILPTYANFSVPDLILSGPNFGSNLGPFLYTLAGTLGATYTAVERSVPAIAFSAGYSVQTPYYDVNTTTKAGLPDPATIAGRLAANLAQQLILNANGGRILPLGYGINVNIPYITSFTNASCINPPFIQTRLTGGAVVDGAVRNNVTGLFTWSNVVADGVNACINGDCTLPGETAVLASGCYSSVSVFTTDYDAPSCQGSAPVRTQLSPLVQLFNSTTLVGGLNGTEKTFGVMNGTTTARNSTVSTSSPTAAATATTNPAISAGVANIISAGSVAALMVVVGAILAL
jgi:5'-nucleotidase